jgi:hypothetical protein
MNEQKIKQTASLNILYSEMPQATGDLFVEIRQWETADSQQQELIVEYGRLLEDGDLQTQVKAMPFYLTVRELLQELNQ